MSGDQQWLVFEKQQDGNFSTRTNKVVYATKETLDRDPNILAVAWEPSGDNRIAEHYLRSSNTASLSPAAEAPPVVANLTGFKIAIFDEQKLPVALKVQIYQFFPLLDTTDSAYWAGAWAQIKEVLDLPAEAVATIEGYATTFNIPLTA